MMIALAGLTTASAQSKGDMAVGVQFGVAPCLETGGPTNMGIGAKFQYNVTDPIRLEADVDYWFKASGCDLFDISANFQYLFKVSDKFLVYPVVGVGYASLGGTAVLEGYDRYNNLVNEVVTGSASVSRVIANVGVGAEYAVSSKISVGAEIKYQYVKDFQRLPINIGVTYKF